MKKAPTLAKLKKQADAVFSEWVRRKDAVNGYATCVTCGAVKPWQQMQAGHYVSRVHLSTRFDPLNVHVQDVGCNIFKSGAMDEYALYLERTFGFAALVELNGKKRMSVKYTRADYEQLINEYREKLSALDEAERLAA